MLYVFYHKKKWRKTSPHELYINYKSEKKLQKWIRIFAIKKYGGGHPWWSSGWASVCQRRGHGFNPWSKRSYMLQRNEAHTLEPLNLNYWACVLQLLKSESLVPACRKREAHSQQLEKAPVQRRRPRAAKKTRYMYILLWRK